MPDIIHFKGSMTDCVNYVRFVYRPYGRNNQTEQGETSNDRPRHHQRRTSRNNSNLKQIPSSSNWKKNETSTSEQEPQESDSDMSIMSTDENSHATDQSQNQQQSSGGKSMLQKKQPDGKEKPKPIQSRTIEFMDQNPVPRKVQEQPGPSQEELQKDSYAEVAARAQRKESQNARLQFKKK
ncbi:Maltose permease MAL61 [Frankliniella fusca]|uniref:Maltose permease MAL61 n=1 Tax=Frankliniella fusca TaxID=407009 RepID=A0AAE1LEF8_9NEOP|nr:Maltose permease MAL61 [Frankliniella fusca]KAK3917061.1 Maltose permease MAL61 [Frankliniella fusca]